MKKINHYIHVFVISFFMISGLDLYATKYSIDVQNFSFSPSNLTTVRIGDTVHWEWKNGSHTTTSTDIPAGASAWDQPMDVSHPAYDYIPAVAGIYHYKCTPHESMGMVGQFTVISVTGLEENSNIPKITVFPNPFRDGVYINSGVQPGVFIKHLTIYDAGGKILHDESFSENSSLPDYIDLSNVQEGLIMFRFTDNLERSYIVRTERKD